jgi:gamma-glutamylcyclotransferase (GGCT)/AIG2-like uncharacterized protein YtfP
MHLLFVYGSLKKNFCRNEFLSEERYLGTAFTFPFYQLHDLGSYPGLIETINSCSDSGENIFGELYEVSEDCIEKIDEIEGVPNLFQRKNIFLGNIFLCYLPLSVEVINSIQNKNAEAYLYCKKLGPESKMIKFWGNSIVEVL